MPAAGLPVDAETLQYYKDGTTVGVAGASKSKYERCSDACQVNIFFIGH